MLYPLQTTEKAQPKKREYKHFEREAVKATRVSIPLVMYPKQTLITFFPPFADANVELKLGTCTTGEG